MFASSLALLALAATATASPHKRWGSGAIQANGQCLDVQGATGPSEGGSTPVIL